MMIRNAIDQFLAEWMEAARAYYVERINEYRELLDAEYEVTRETLESVLTVSFNPKRKYSDEQIDKILKLDSEIMHIRHEDEIRSSMRRRWEGGHLKAEVAIVKECCYSRETEQLGLKRLDEILRKEAEQKKKKLVTTIQKKAGKIIDASDLHIADSGELNGTVTGELATVKVNTIYAGGHNVQCLHFRTLVKAVK